MNDNLKAQMLKYDDFNVWAKKHLRSGDLDKFQKLFDEAHGKRKRRTKAQIEAANEQPSLEGADATD